MNNVYCLKAPWGQLLITTIAFTEEAVWTRTNMDQETAEMTGYRVVPIEIKEIV